MHRVLLLTHMYTACCMYSLLSGWFIPCCTSHANSRPAYLVRLVGVFVVVLVGLIWASVLLYMSLHSLGSCEAVWGVLFPSVQDANGWFLGVFCSCAEAAAAAFVAKALHGRLRCYGAPQQGRGFLHDMLF